MSIKRRNSIQARAKALNLQHERYSAGFYSSLGGRFFLARVKAGVLQVSDFETWRDVEPGENFRDHNGRDIPDANV